jgi:hypothetical protein
MNRKGHIAILLLLCFSVVLIHSMVPHHHHHGVVAESSASCCDEHHSHHNAQDQCSCDAHPNHCDAFNEITFFKSSGSRIVGPPVLNSLFLAAPGSDMLQLADRSTDPGFYVPRTIQYIACPGGRSISLRGPPGPHRF